MTQSEYLEHEFHRYFPDTEITVYTNLSETIDVFVRDTPNSDPDFIFRMEIGSDDPWYRFADANGIVVTIPLEPKLPTYESVMRIENGENA